MNDHVPKPVEPEQLYRSLVRWLSPLEDDRPALPAVSEPVVASAGLEAIDGLEMATGLRYLGGQMERYRRLLGQFVETHGEDAALLSAQLAGGDLTSVRQTAHALKGAA